MVEEEPPARNGLASSASLPRRCALASDGRVASCCSRVREAVQRPAEEATMGAALTM